MTGHQIRARLRVTLAVASAAGAVALAVPASAASPIASRTSATAVVTHQQAVESADQQAVLDYWSPERIAALTEPASDKPPTARPDGAPWTRQNALPATVGRLFFTDHGEDSSCTATVVEAENRSTVVTGGHCVNNTNLIGNDDQWASNVLFIPGYRDGAAPYGKFVGRVGVAAATWLQNDQEHGEKYDQYDQAFVVLNPNARGQRVQDVAGAQKTGFDRPGGRTVHQFGYPRATEDPAREGLPEYTGARLAYCTGSAREDHGTADSPEPKGIWGAACVMGGGSSGGPRIADFNAVTGLGTVVGVNTQGTHLDASGATCGFDDKSCTRYLVGPQFSSAITKPLYDRAQRAY